MAVDERSRRPDCGGVTLRPTLITTFALTTFFAAACGGAEQELDAAPHVPQTATTEAGLCYVATGDDVGNFCDLTCAREVPNDANPLNIAPAPTSAGLFALSVGGNDVDVFRVHIPSSGSWILDVWTGPAQARGTSIDTSCVILDSTPSCNPIAFESLDDISSSDRGCYSRSKLISPSGPGSYVLVAVARGAATPNAKGQYRLFTALHTAHGEPEPTAAPYPGDGGNGGNPGGFGP